VPKAAAAALHENVTSLPWADKLCKAAKFAAGKAVMARNLFLRPPARTASDYENCSQSYSPIGRAYLFK